MAKNNPLFIDSTRLHGDRIGTQIELTGILIYDDETVLVVVTNHLGEVDRVSMKLSEELTFQARVWLGHQKTINFRFVIEKAGKIILQSVTHHARAQYVISENWIPVLVEEASQPAVEANISLPIPAGYTSTVASLIEKWGL